MLKILRTGYAFRQYVFFRCKNAVANERGEVSIIAMVVLIAIAVLLAVVFRNAIEALLRNLFEGIFRNVDDATKEMEDVHNNGN